MSSGDTYQGRRREDVRFGELPHDLELGDYWKYLNGDGQSIRSSTSENLTGTVWGFYGPVPGAGVGTLMHHTVREHEDGTATIAPGDGSSNSVLTSGRSVSWHGYLERGVWREV